MFPTVVICLSPIPSRPMTKICFLPVRVDMNATCRPFGAYAGLSLLPCPPVSCRRACVARS